MFSLCIPTIDRYDNFLINYLPKYINNNLIDEIIINDENGNDVNKIKNSGMDLIKLKLFVNEKKLGPFLNKIDVCKKAKNDWIALIDSDNFADISYFEIAKKYINKLEKELVILSPSWARPNFDYREIENFIYKKGNFLRNRKEERKRRIKNCECCMNTGNYILNKKIFSLINLDNEQDNILKSSACDVIYFNTLCFEQLDIEMHIVKDMHYDHVVHNESIYIKTCQKYPEFNSYVHNRFRKLR